MSGFVEVLTAAMFLAIGNATEKEMRPYVWEQAGLCKVDAQSTAETCNWSDTSRECRTAQARNLPCPINHNADMRDLFDEESSAIPSDEQTFQELKEPRWVPSIDGGMKLQL
jgi:hypothetical protein